MKAHLHGGAWAYSGEYEEDSEVATDSGDDCLRTSEDRARSDAPGQPKEPGPTAFQGQ